MLLHQQLVAVLKGIVLIKMMRKAKTSKHLVKKGNYDV